jgi:hypothetical protein
MPFTFFENENSISVNYKRVIQFSEQRILDGSPEGCRKKKMNYLRGNIYLDVPPILWLHILEYWYGFIIL